MSDNEQHNASVKDSAGSSGAPAPSSQELPASVCDEFRLCGGKLALEHGVDASVIGACAAHTGIQFMLRGLSPEQVAEWLEHEASELREFIPRTPRTRS